MKREIIIEIVDFKIIEGTEERDFISIVDDLEKAYHSQQKRFIDTELLRGKESGQWIMLQHWGSFEDAVASSRLLMKSELTEAFRRIIIPSSVKMSMLEQVGFWKV